MPAFRRTPRVRAKHPRTFKIRMGRDNRMRGTRLSVAVAGGLLLITAGACGSGSKSSDEAKSVATAVASAVSAARTVEATRAPASSAAPSSAASASPTVAAVQALEVKAADFTFDPKDLTVEPGQVKLTLTNTSTERPHTINVKTKSGDGDLVKSERVAAGQSGTIEFTVADEGSYEIYCSLPGHADRGQKGTLTVKRS